MGLQFEVTVNGEVTVKGELLLAAREPPVGPSCRPVRLALVRSILVSRL